MNEPRGVQVAMHGTCYELDQAHLVMVLIGGDDALGIIIDDERMRKSVVGQLIASMRGERRIVAFGAKKSSEWCATARARFEHIDIRKRREATFAKESARRVANSTACRPKRFGYGLSELCEEGAEHSWYALCVSHERDAIAGIFASDPVTLCSLSHVSLLVLVRILFTNRFFRCFCYTYPPSFF